MIIKAFLLMILLAVPLFAGMIFVSKSKLITLRSLLESYVLGAFALWAVFQLMTVSFIYLRFSFNTLFISFLIVIGVFTVFGIIGIKNKKWKLSISLPKSPVIWLIALLTIGIIALQVVMYAVGLHLDEDDARWLSQANDAVVHNSMFLYNPATGVYIGRLVGDMVRDSYSPWPMFIAFVARFTGFNVATMAHTILAPILLLLSYGAFYLIGTCLFKSFNERLIFLFSVSVIMLFFWGYSASEAAFALSRIWQGKATVAGVVIPTILWMILRIQEEDTCINWILLSIIGCASCLFSGMGILISAIMIGGYGLYIVVFRKKWKRIPLWVLAIAPSAIFELISQVLN